VKKFFAGILAAVGISANAQPETEMIDVNSILYSMPTISGDALEFVVPTKETFEGAPEFHEDEWCQLEFFPQSELEDLKKKLDEYKKFEQNNRASSGWKNIYVRNIPRVGFRLKLKDLGLIEGAVFHPSPLLTTASSLLGQVKGGFSVSIGDGALLYGISEGEIIKSLAASVYSDAGNIALTDALMSLDSKEKLMVVDWRGQMIIMGSPRDGKLEVWKP